MKYYDVEQVFLVERVNGQKEVGPVILVSKDIHDPEFKHAFLEPLDYLAVTQEKMILSCQKILDMNREILARVEQELEN